MADLDPFITVDDLSAYLKRDVSTDDGAIIAVDAACDICRDVAGQNFNRGTATFALDGSGTDVVLLPQLPVNSAGTVTVNGGSITDYVLGSNGALFRGTAGIDPRPRWPSGRQNVVVTADVGYEIADVPRSLRMVALAIAGRIIVQGPATQEAVGQVSVKYAAASTDLTNGERLILERYRP